MTNRAVVALACAAFAGGPAAAGPHHGHKDKDKDKDKEPAKDLGPKEAPPPAPAPQTEPEPPPRPLPKPGDKRRIVAILDVRVGEGVPVEVAQQFQHDLDQMVDPQHYFLEPRSRVHDLMANSTKWTDGCVIGPCIREVKAQTQADVALIAALTGSGTSFGSVITLVRTDTGHVLDQRSARCDVCTLNEALATAEHASVKLLDALPPQLPDPEAAEHAAVTVATRPLEARLTAAHHHHVASGVTLAILGALAAGTGIVLYALEDHAGYGLATAAAGGGLLLSGVVVLAF